MKPLAMITLSLTLLCSKTHAQVNLQDGSFNYIAEDFGFLPRIYSSRSVHTGAFGLGWCSPLDLTPDRNCGPVLAAYKSKFQIQYQDNRPHEMTHQGFKFKIEWSSDQKRIQKISRTQLHFVQYNYSGNRLISHRGDNTAQLRYDQNLNLSQIITPQNVLQIIYDENKDLVQELKPLSGCQEHYKFTDQSSSKSSLSQRSEVFKICPGQPPELMGRYDFTYTKSKNGKIKLTGVQSWQLQTPKSKTRISRGTE